MLALIFLITAALCDDYVLMPIDGTATGIYGYVGLSYQAARYEPLCGRYGTSSWYDTVFDGYSPDLGAWGCQAAMDDYSNSSDSMAIYDTTGIRLADVRVGGGLDTCMCFSLTRDDHKMEDFCFWINGNGQAAYGTFDALGGENGIISSHRPNSRKALPLCNVVDVASLSSKWSATAYQPTISEYISTVGNGKPTTQTVVKTSIKTIVTTSVPSIVPYTSTSTFTSVLANGNSTTITTAIPTQAPVVTATATSLAPTPSVTTTSSGYSQSDNIALGVGIGIGLPVLIIAFWQCVKRSKSP